MYGYAITEPHFPWAIDDDRDVVLLFVLFFASIAASEIGPRSDCAAPSPRALPWALPRALRSSGRGARGPPRRRG
jgi:hypothetical protein